MKNFFSILIVISLMIFSIQNFASDKHEDKDHHENEAEHTHEEGHDDKKGSESHAENEKDEHGHEENENSQVGPGKGIVKASEDEGIQISPEAEKNFEIQRVRISSLDKIEIPKSAVVTAGTEVNLYRYRSGNYKRIDFEILSKGEKQLTIRSSGLKRDDEIVVRGTALLRIAEIAAFGGAPEGHSH